MSFYRKDPNDSSKQIPVKKAANHFDRHSAPLSCSFTKTPHYVIVNTTPSNPIGFAFGFTSHSFSALGANTGSADNYTNFGKPTAGTTININPCAWSGSAGDAGKITFVYKGGPDGMGRP